MPSFRLRAVALILAIWAVAGVVVYLARSAKATPESVLAYTAAHPMDQEPAENRQQVLEKTASQLNQLTYEQRREVRLGKKMDAFYKGLSPEEQSRFLDLTMPAGFKQMMDAFNKMDPVKRKAVAERALEDMRRQGEEGAPPRDDPNMKKMVEHGLHSFYSDASAETKLDFAPLIEQMQHNMQGLH